MVHRTSRHQSSISFVAPCNLNELAKVVLKKLPQFYVLTYSQGITCRHGLWVLRGPIWHMVQVLGHHGIHIWAIQLWIDQKKTCRIQCVYYVQVLHRVNIRSRDVRTGHLCVGCICVSVGKKYRNRVRCSRILWLKCSTLYMHFLCL